MLDMTKTKEELLAELSRCVLEMEEDEVTEAAKEYARLGFDPTDGILFGLVNGMNRASDLYEQEEYFIPELLICSSAMYNGLDVLRPLLPKNQAGGKCKVVIGVVQGDTHDIGKNLVKIMLESAGYEMVDLGRDVPVEKFVSAVKDEGARVLGLSTLMSTSMKNMKKIIDLLYVVVGGAPVSSSFAAKIGADGYSANATDAVRLVNRLTAKAQARCR